MNQFVSIARGFLSSFSTKNSVEEEWKKKSVKDKPTETFVVKRVESKTEDLTTSDDAVETSLPTKPVVVESVVPESSVSRAQRSQSVKPASAPRRKSVFGNKNTHTRSATAQVVTDGAGSQLGLFSRLLNDDVVDDDDVDKNSNEMDYERGIKNGILSKTGITSRKRSVHVFSIAKPVRYRSLFLSGDLNDGSGKSVTNDSVFVKCVNTSTTSHFLSFSDLHNEVQHEMNGEKRPRLTRLNSGLTNGANRPQQRTIQNPINRSVKIVTSQSVKTIKTDYSYQNKIAAKRLGKMIQTAMDHVNEADGDDGMNPADRAKLIGLNAFANNRKVADDYDEDGYDDEMSRKRSDLMANVRDFAIRKELPSSSQHSYHRSRTTVDDSGVERRSSLKLAYDTLIAIHPMQNHVDTASIVKRPRHGFDFVEL